MFFFSKKIVSWKQESDLLYSFKNLLRLQNVLLLSKITVHLWFYYKIVVYVGCNFVFFPAKLINNSGQKKHFFSELKADVLV